MTTFSHQSRVAIVTGSTNGMGLAIAQHLLAGGAHVVLNGRREKVLNQIEIDLSSQYPGKVAAVAGDASSPKVINQLFEICETKLGRSADIVISNAGRGLLGSPSTAKLEEFGEVLQTNLVGVANLLQETSRRFREIIATSKPLERPFDIVVIGSTVGRNLSPFSALYGSTKFAVHSIAEALRRELAAHGVRVSLIEPGIVESGFQEVAGYAEEMLKGFQTKFGPLLKPNDVAEAVSYLVSLPAHVHINEIMIRPTRQDYP